MLVLESSRRKKKKQVKNTYLKVLVRVIIRSMHYSVEVSLKSVASYCKYVGNSSESVILGEKALKRIMGIQASVPDVKGKHDDADNSDDEDVKKEEADADKDSAMEKSTKLKNVKDDTSDAIKMSKHKMRKKLKKLKKVMEYTSNDE